MAEEMRNSQTQRILGEMYAGEGKCRVENEGILPDYKEPAQKILRVDAKARVSSKSLYKEGQNLICEVDGVVSFSVLYRTDRNKEKGIPSSYLMTENFSHTFRIPTKEETLAEEIAAVVDLRTENVSCKLLGPRKLSLRCDTVVMLHVKSNREISYCTSELPSHVYAKEREICPASLFGVYREEIEFSETISLPKNHLSIGELCGMEADLFTKKVLVENGGITFSGFLDVMASYVPAEEETLVSFYQPIEFEKSIGIEGCAEGQIAEVILTPDFLKGTTDVNEDGENKNVVFQVGCTAEIRLYQKESLTVAEDAFSVEHCLDQETGEVEYEEILSSFDFSSPLRGNFISEEKGFLRAEWVRCGADLKNSYSEEGKIAMEGKLVFRYLGIKEDGEAVPLEYSEPFRILVSPENASIPENALDLRIEISISPRGADVDPLGERHEYRVELHGHVVLVCRKKIRLITSLSMGEALEKEPCQLIFYYPDEKEDLWSIAKKYKISPKELEEKNKGEGKTLPPVIVMIR